MEHQGETSDLDRRWHGAFIPENDWHFHRNLLKRYNAILTVGEYSRIGKKIAKGKFKLIERREGHPGAVYAVRIQNCSDWVYIVALRQKLVTALPASKRLKRLHEAQLTQPTE